MKGVITMTVNGLFKAHLDSNSDVDGYINSLAEIIDSEDHDDGEDEYYNVNDNEVRGYFENDNFYITGVNDYELNSPIQFNY